MLKTQLSLQASLSPVRPVRMQISLKLSSPTGSHLLASSPAPTDLNRAGELVLVNPAACRRLWALSPYMVEWNEANLSLALDYGSDPILVAATPRRVTLTITNAGREARSVRVALSGLPASWKASGLPADDLAIPAGESRRLDLAITAASVDERPTRLTVDVSGGAKPIAMPLTLIGLEGVGPARNRGGVSPETPGNGPLLLLRHKPTPLLLRGSQPVLPAFSRYSCPPRRTRIQSRHWFSRRRN